MVDSIVRDKLVSLTEMASKTADVLTSDKV